MSYSVRNTQAQNSTEKSGKHYQLHPKLKQQQEQQRQSEDSQDK